MNISTLEYLPSDPTAYRPAIGLIGCGAITEEHLTAYRDAGYNVVALCDIDCTAAEARREAEPVARLLAQRRAVGRLVHKLLGARLQRLL